MASSVFPVRLDETDRYLLRRLALVRVWVLVGCCPRKAARCTRCPHVERGQSANALVTMLVRAEIERALPGAREAYQRRGEVAEQVLRRRGVDLDSADYQAARRHARSMLDAADNRHRDHTA